MVGNSFSRAEPFCRLATQPPLAVRTDFPLGQCPRQPRKAQVCPCSCHTSSIPASAFLPRAFASSGMPFSSCSLGSSCLVFRPTLSCKTPAHSLFLFGPQPPSALGSACLGCHMPVRHDAPPREGGRRLSSCIHSFFTHVSFTKEEEAKAQRG